MSLLKGLVKDTAIYGLSSIVGRFLNWLLVPLYTYKLQQTGDYGIVTNLYAIVALLMVLLTFGMETTFFRFANKENSAPNAVFSTSIVFLSLLSGLFALLCVATLGNVSQWLQYGGHSNLILMMVVVLIMDVIMAVPFCYLRFQSKAVKFATLKLLFIFLNIGLNLFFLLACPWLYEHHAALVSWFFVPGEEIKYIIVSNLMATAIQFMAVMPIFNGVKFLFDQALLKQMITYSFPLVILGLAGMLNQTADKILLPLLIDNKQEALSQLGIYGANFKIAVVMVMFAQAFRFAYEPFFFAQSKKDGKESGRVYADAMKYFVLFGLVIFLGVAFYMDILRFFIGPAYQEGLKVVPVVMIAELMFGIFFNLSIWYKLTDNTRWGAYFSVGGAVVTVLLNVLFVPAYGYWACAWAGLVSYLLMTLFSYLMGQKRYPIPYEVKRLSGYALIALLLFAGFNWFAPQQLWGRLTIGTVLLFSFVGLIWQWELKGAKLFRR